MASRVVFRCFKTLERIGDKITGAAGPFFVTLAVGLLSTGTFAFFEVVAPNLSLKIVSIPLCLLIATNLLMHYYYVCTVKPGYVLDPPPEHGTSIFWAQPRSQRASVQGVRWSNDVKITPAATTKCAKCSQTKPERTHHCRICKRCVLKFDHHCPWVNQCVGIYNERHFVLFLLYLGLSSFCFAALGWPQVMESLGLVIGQPWPYYTPLIAFVLISILSIVICFAVGIMGGYHLYTITNGETTVEAQDHDAYRKIAKHRGEKFTNSYDLGRMKNLQLFFNIGENGYSYWTLVLPLRILPYTDGRSWARRPGYDQHAGITQADQLTDDEEEA